MIEQYRDEYKVTMMCKVLSVSRSGYYSWRDRAVSSRTQAREQLDVQVKALFDSERARAGSSRIHRALLHQGIHAGKHKVANSLKRQGSCAKAARKYQATTNSTHRLPVVPNLMQQDFSAQRANQKWVSDITYIATDEGWLYLAVILDVYSRSIVGWSMSDRMTATLVCDALTMAMFKRHCQKYVIVHSDRGSQYCSSQYQALLTHHELICNMSKRGDCGQCGDGKLESQSESRGYSW